MKVIVFAIISFILLTASFKWNVVNGARDEFFNDFQMDSEALAVGRMHLSQQEGPFSHSGFAGLVLPDGDEREGMKKYYWQYPAYIHELSYTGYEEYFSQPAIQTFIYYCIVKPFGIKGQATLNLLYLFCSAFISAVMVLFLLWVIRIWGMPVAIAVMVAILFSQWITVFGRNLYWILGGFYIPFIISLWFFESKSGRSLHWYAIFLALYVPMVIKCLLNGFEYISCILVMAMVPFVFYGIYHKWGWGLGLEAIASGSGTASSGGYITIDPTCDEPSRWLDEKHRILEYSYRFECQPGSNNSCFTTICDFWDDFFDFLDYL